VLRAAERNAVPRDAALDPTPPEAQLAALEPQALLARFDALADQRRAVHDLYHDWVSAGLSHVYRRFGVEALEDCLRQTGRLTLLRWMPRDLANPPEQRVRRWAAMLLGNFARIQIEEDDEKFVLSQSLCGSCGRQLEAGCYGAEPGFAIVRERHPISFNRGDVPVYRTHVAVLHYLVPIQQSGVPWPAIACPAGQAPGPCRLLLYKDPARTPTSHWSWLSP